VAAHDQERSSEKPDARAGAVGQANDPPPGPIPVVRSGIAGVLMGLANLVPGVSGGTMILVMGLYDDFVTSVADITRLHFTRRNVLFMLLIVCAAGLTIGLLSGPVKHLVAVQQSAMYSLFIGMTLGGAPLLYKMLRPIKTASVVGLILGLALMVGIKATDREKPDKAAVVDGTVLVEPAYGRDVAAGALGISAMILPGISGAYLLLVLGRYVVILAAIAELMTWATSLGKEGDLAAGLHVLVPVAIGALVCMVALSNFLKWVLHRHAPVTLGLLLGVLLGSVIGIWPFSAASQPRDYGIGAALAIAGFLATWQLSSKTSKRRKVQTSKPRSRSSAS
jgi:putative membrane protein